MAINFYQRVIYSNQLEHGVKGQRSSHHKYLYIDANGRYVYPEDLPKGTTGIQQHHAQVLSDRRQEKKQAKKDKAFVKRSKQMEDATNRLWDIHDGSTTATNFIKSHQQVQRAHQNATSGFNFVLFCVYFPCF